MCYCWRLAAVHRWVPHLRGSGAPSISHPIALTLHALIRSCAVFSRSPLRHGEVAAALVLAPLLLLRWLGFGRLLPRPPTAPLPAAPPHRTRSVFSTACQRLHRARCWPHLAAKMITLRTICILPPAICPLVCWPSVTATAAGSVALTPRRQAPPLEMVQPAAPQRPFCF